MLRQLEERDIPGMLEWMHDEETSRCFRFDSLNTTYDNAKKFVENSLTSLCRHYAVVDAMDVYMGTISLKNINVHDLNAEYAICMRKKARGTGMAEKATEEILKIAFKELGLKKVYLNVLNDNVRAISFYEKFGFHFEGEFVHHVCIHGEWKNLKWYAIEKEQFYEKRKIL